MCEKMVTQIGSKEATYRRLTQTKLKLNCWSTIKWNAKVMKTKKWKVKNKDALANKKIRTCLILIVL